MNERKWQVNEHWWISGEKDQMAVGGTSSYWETIQIPMSESSRPSKLIRTGSTLSFVTAVAQGWLQQKQPSQCTLSIFPSSTRIFFSFSQTLPDTGLGCLVFHCHRLTPLLSPHTHTHFFLALLSFFFFWLKDLWLFVEAMPFLAWHQAVYVGMHFWKFVGFQTKVLKQRAVTRWCVDARIKSELSEAKSVSLIWLICMAKRKLRRVF